MFSCAPGSYKAAHSIQAGLRPTAAGAVKGVRYGEKALYRTKSAAAACGIPPLYPKSRVVCHSEAANTTHELVRYGGVRDGVVALRALARRLPVARKRRPRRGRGSLTIESSRRAARPSNRAAAQVKRGRGRARRRAPWFPAVVVGSPRRAAPAEDEVPRPTPASRPPCRPTFESSRQLGPNKSQIDLRARCGRERFGLGRS